MPSFSAAASDLGLGDALSEQVAGETEEMRKKRLREYQLGDATGSAARDLLGSLKAGAQDWWDSGAGRLLGGGAVDPMRNRKNFLSSRPR